MIDSWKKAIVKPNITIRDALKIIDSGALRVALVVDDQLCLLGIISDGDIRRGLLCEKSLDSPAIEVMNTTPITAPSGFSREKLIQRMNEHDVLFIPIVEEHKLVGLETLHSALVTKPSYNNPVFIMAGGFGTRLRPLTDNCPKPMLKVGDRPILETLIKGFIKAGFHHFYISTHYMPEQIHQHFGDGSDLGINISYVHENIPLGTGGALGLLPEDMPKDLPLLMINGDILTNVDFQRLLKFHMENDADATMCVREYDYQIPYGVINGEGSKITSMVEKPVQRFFVNAGIYVVSPQVIQSVEKNQKIDMPTLLELHMEKRQKVLMFPIHEYWLDIGRIDDFNRAQVDISNLGLD